MAWHPEGDREVYSREELVRLFRLEDVRKSSPIFDLHKLEWLNGLYMRELIQHNIDRVVDLCAEILQDAHLIEGPVSAELRSYIAAVINILGDRLKIGTDILTYGDFFFKDEVDYDPEGAARYLKTPNAPVVLGALRDRLAKEMAFGADTLEHLVRHLADERGISTREIIHPARMALTGKTVGPGLFELMAVLGKERVLQRLDRAIASGQQSIVT
jgi:glutamyl-tRNA synthetase